MWANLPDELIQNIMSYWSPHNAKDFERIKKLMNRYQTLPKDPNYYIKMLMEHPENTNMTFRFTKSCLFYRRHNDDCQGERRINFIKKLKDYHNFLHVECKREFDRIIRRKFENIDNEQPAFYQQAIIELYKENKDFWTYESTHEGFDKWNYKYTIFKEFYKHVIKKEIDIWNLFDATLNCGKYFGMGEYAGEGHKPRMLP